jgi:hypothetical protein
MPWEKRGVRAYFYRSVRRGGRVQRLYMGTGAAGRMAADADALRRAEQKVEEEARRAHRDQLDAAMTLTCDLNRGCELLAAATLLAAGYHRPCRHVWRTWRDGRRALRNAP